MVVSRARQSYDGVVLAVPVTVPYQRYSIETAHWWMGKALRALAEGAGISHRDFDGFSVASFTMGPDAAIALTQHFGLSPRWLDHLPMGGAAGIASIR
ncbi:thiolase family protein, partial [Neorhizobium sp. SHOUNA12B]|nr:thiolase family protein [Neorhizobium sp. SHOUNA12B]